MKSGHINPFLRYISNVLILIDQGFNTVFLLGDPDETISSRMAKWARSTPGKWHTRVGKLVCGFLHLLDPNHCEKSIELDEGKKNILEPKD